MELDVTWAGIPRLTLIELPPLLGVWVARLPLGYFYREVPVSHVCINCEWLIFHGFSLRGMYWSCWFAVASNASFGTDKILSQNIQSQSQMLHVWIIFNYMYTMLHTIYKYVYVYIYILWFIFIGSKTDHVGKCLGFLFRSHTKESKKTPCPRQSGAFHVIEMNIYPSLEKNTPETWIPQYSYSVTEFPFSQHYFFVRGGGGYPC